MTWRDRLGLITVMVNGKPTVGTGLWVTRNRVLTARHVFADAVDWKIQPVNGYPAIEIDASMIRWEGKGVIDAVVLEVDHPDPRASGHLIISQPISETRHCESGGFALVSASAPAEPTPDGGIFYLTGKLHPATESSAVLSFSVEQGLEKIDQLSGVSGAPAMVQGQVYGIVQGGPKELKGRTLHVIDIQRVEDAEFWSALCVPKVQNRCRSLLGCAKALLSREKTLNDELAVEIQKLLSLSSPIWDADQLVDEIHQRVPAGALLKLLKRMQKKGNDSKRREAIGDLGQILVPVAFWRGLDLERARISADFMLLPYFNKVTAEIVQAAFDGRRLEPIPVADGALRSQWAIEAPFPPEDGGSAGQAEEDFLKALFDALLTAPQIGPHLALFRESAKSVSEPKRTDELLKLVNYALEQDRDDPDSSIIYYLVVDKATKSRYGKHAEVVLKRFQMRVPNLRVVVLDGEDEQFAEGEGFILLELQQFYQLCNQTAPVAS